MDPRTIIRFIYEEWQLVTELFKAAREGPIARADVINIVAVHKRVEFSEEACLSKLLDLGVLDQPISSETRYAIAEPFHSLIAHLLHEQHLDLAETIRVRIVDIESLAKTLHQRAIEGSREDFERYAEQFSRQIRTIKQQSHNDHLALRNIADRVKSRESRVPIKRRYAEVLEAWDTYITPMVAMCSPHGPFDQMLDSTRALLKDAQRHLRTAGSLYSLAELTDFLLRLIDDLREVLVQQLGQSRDELLPLYNAARIHSGFTRNVARLLEALRKGRIVITDLDGLVPIFSRPRFRGVASNQALLKLFAELGKPRANAPLAPRPRAKPPTAPQVSRNAILRELRQRLPLRDLMAWLITTYPDLATRRLLDVVQQTREQDGIAVTIGDRATYETMYHIVHGRVLSLERRPSARVKGRQ